MIPARLSYEGYSYMSKMTTIALSLETHTKLHVERLAISAEVGEIISFNETVDCILTGRQVWLAKRKEKILEMARLEAERKEAAEQSRLRAKIEKAMKG